MSLIISTGSNLGNREKYLSTALEKLCSHFDLIAKSKLYHSKAVDYLDQPDFINQVLEFKLPTIQPTDALSICLDIESSMGRERIIAKGPRTIDIDILLWAKEKINDKNLQVPHPRMFDRHFIMNPLSELPYAKHIADIGKSLKE